MSKQYLVVDMAGNENEICNWKELKELLIQEVTNSIYSDYEERDIVEQNVGILRSLALDSMTLKEIKQELECYNYKTIDLINLQRDLEDFKQYWGQIGNYMGNFDMCLNHIKGVIAND